jgi:hypothetical protein
MKLNKSTIILLNVMLILIVVLLVKSIIFEPKNLYAAKNFEYKTIRFGSRSAEASLLTEEGKNGWRLVCLGYQDDYAVLERER